MSLLLFVISQLCICLQFDPILKMFPLHKVWNLSILWYLQVSSKRQLNFKPLQKHCGYYFWGRQGVEKMNSSHHAVITGNQYFVSWKKQLPVASVTKEAKPTFMHHRMQPCHGSSRMCVSGSLQQLLLR